MTVQTVEIVKIFPTHYWVESDVLGTKHIMVQHEGMEPFTYASFNYDYAFTDNATIHMQIVNMMKQFGVEEKDIDWRSKSWPPSKWWHEPVFKIYMSYLWLKRKFAK